MSNEPSTAEYCCPGETQPIPRAVHLARLADCNPACRECARRMETVGLSQRQVRRLDELHAETMARPLFAAEGIGDVAINDVDPPLARAIAIEFARLLESSRHAPHAVRQNVLHADEGDTNPKRKRGPEVVSSLTLRVGVDSAISASEEYSSRTQASDACYLPLVFACDGRLSTAPIVAAIVEGLRWSGCEAIDLGAASAPSMTHAIEQHAAGGGIYLGNPTGAAHTLGMKFWDGGEPLSQGDFLDALAAAVRDEYVARDRPARTFGPLRRVDGAEDYLREIRPAYHALRPLRFVLRCTCAPVVTYLDDLLQNVACCVMPAGPGGDIGRQVVAAKAHFGIEIDDDGERACIYDEQGRAVESVRLARVVGLRSQGSLVPPYRSRQETYRGMQASGETLAVDTAGRIWYAAGHAPAADALKTLTLLLVLLSRDDMPFSVVLDRDAEMR